MISVVTPTFNRSALLPRLYQSLIGQTNKAFEWLVIDDGSEDRTCELIRGYQEEGLLFINYFKKDNAGKHSALNLGFTQSVGQWVFIVDSDDFLDPQCIETLYTEIQNVGVSIDSISILRRMIDGRIIGDDHDESLTTYIERMEKKIKGDKADIFRKKALTGFQFPVYEGEKFMPEGFLFLWFGTRFKTKFVNYAGYITEYQENGLSANSVTNRHSSYRSSLQVYASEYRLLDSRSLRFRAAINWWRFRIGKRAYGGSREIPVMYLPAGLLLYVIDFVRVGSVVVAR